MTPLQLAKTECCNCRPDATCAGITYRSTDGRFWQSALLHAEKPCVVAEERCEFFERCVLPLVDQAPPSDDARLQASRMKAREQYRRKHNLPGRQSAHLRTCPDCGGELAPRRRVCPACAIKRRQAAYRQARDSRRSAQQLRPKTES